MKTKQNRFAAWKRGHWAEAKCVWFLRLKGYRILQRRFKTKSGEVDIIARRFSTLLFIEVKARKTRNLGLASISPKQQQRIYHTAQIFLSKIKKNHFKQIRFDVMVVVPWQIPYHLKDAWRIKQ